MKPIEGEAGVIHELARYEVRSESLEECVAAILCPNCIAPVEFVEYRQVDANAELRPDFAL